MWTDSCRWVRARLPLMAGGDLIGPDRRRAQRHLINCPACRRDLKALRGSLGVLRAAAALPVAAATDPAPSLWPELARQIRESRRPARWASPWPAFGWFWPSLGLAAGLVAVVLTPGLLRHPGHVARPPRGPSVVQKDSRTRPALVPPRLVVPTAPPPRKELATTPTAPPPRELLVEKPRPPREDPETSSKPSLPEPESDRVPAASDSRDTH